MADAETIASSGFPLGFLVHRGNVRLGSAAGTGRRVVAVEARHYTRPHQKEAVVSECSGGDAWRMVSDEGVHIKGDDLAPFPLGFFNAGLQADLANRLLALARARGIGLDTVHLHCRTGYSMTGSFLKGDGVGAATPADIRVNLRSSASEAAIRALVADAVHTSPALAAMRVPLQNTFALYVNGKRRKIATMSDAGGADATDPLTIYHRAPAPLKDYTALPDLIIKTGKKREGTPALTAPAGTPGSPIVREVAGDCRVLDASGVTQTDVALQLPGMSHFALISDESAQGRAPSGLALLSAGIAFCYMTQLSRYIDYLKLAIRHVRLVQFNPYTCDAHGGAEPVATHLFLQGDESNETFEKLMRVSANTCFLHATLKAALPPRIGITLNDTEIQ